MHKPLWTESANEDQLFAQTLWYLWLAANSQLLLLYPSLILFTCPLMPLSLQTNPRDCDHILVFISIKTPSRAISGLWVTLCSGLGNVTFTDLKRPFKGRQQCLSGIPENMYICPRAKGESSHSSSPSQTVYDGVHQRVVRKDLSKMKKPSWD